MPFVEKATIIARGIRKINVLSLFKNIFSIAGSNSHAVADVLIATRTEKIAAKKIFSTYLLI